MKPTVANLHFDEPNPYRAGQIVCLKADEEQLDIGEIFKVVVLVVVSVAAGLFFGYVLTAQHYQREAVKHGAASYDPQTGLWGWEE